MVTDPLGVRARPALDPVYVHEAVRRFLAEDVGAGDATTAALVPPGLVAAGRIVARQSAVIAGLSVAREVFAQLDPTVMFEPAIGDGAAVGHGTTVAVVRGRARAILTAERTALNILQRLSGIATLTRQYVEAVAGTGVTVSDTRKTTPGLRLFEKYAVAVGGGRNHRTGLFDAILVKDNHIMAAGGIHAALERLAAAQPSLPVQIEVDSLDELKIALRHGIRAVLLDNMSPAVIAEAVRLVRASPGGGACWIEASGGITLSTIRAYAETGIDTISVGALTHAAAAADIALDLEWRGD